MLMYLSKVNETKYPIFEYVQKQIINPRIWHSVSLISPSIAACNSILYPIILHKFNVHKRKTTFSFNVISFCIFFPLRRVKNIAKRLQITLITMITDKMITNLTSMIVSYVYLWRFYEKKDCLRLNLLVLLFYM